MAARKPVAKKGVGRKPVARALAKPGAKKPPVKGPTGKAARTATTPRRPALPAALRGERLVAYAREVYARLERMHPDAHCELDHANALQLLVATILSAQCTDKRVNMVTPSLFAAYPTAEALADAPVESLEELVRATGFFRNKARSVQGMARAVVARHGGAVPDEMEALVELPGVGRKTANVILGNAFGKNDGVVVDTHVGRLAVRLGFTGETDPVKVEQALMPLFPRESWTMLAHLLIFHGRRICEARSPRCGECGLNDICPTGRVRLEGEGEGDGEGRGRAGRKVPRARSGTKGDGRNANPRG